MVKFQTDQAGGVRAGEELDAAALEAYLRAHVPLGEGALAVEQFGSGYSNLTYLLRIGGRELVLRRPPAGANVKGGHDMSREYRILAGLEGVYAKAPRPLHFCADSTVIGAPFYVMERVHGVILRGARQAVGDLEPQTMRRVSEALIDTLAELHAVDYMAAGLGELGKPEGYAQRQVEGWRQRYAQAAADEVAAMDAVGEWLSAQLGAFRPSESASQTGRVALIHNDFKLDNVVLNPHDLTQVTAVLDWEMATIGDPLLDLGVTLAYWIQEGDPPVLQRIGLGRLPGALSRGEAATYYARRRGLGMGDRASFDEQVVFAYVLGLYKVAVIAQQIYRRYRQGFTQDPRFSGLGAVVAACAEMAMAAMRSGRIE